MHLSCQTRIVVAACFAARIFGILSFNSCPGYEMPVVNMSEDIDSWHDKPWPFDWAIVYKGLARLSIPVNLDELAGFLVSRIYKQVYERNYLWPWGPVSDLDLQSRNHALLCRCYCSSPMCRIPQFSAADWQRVHEYPDAGLGYATGMYGFFYSLRSSRDG